jgi:hypothetical protein
MTRRLPDVEDQKTNHTEIPGSDKDNAYQPASLAGALVLPRKSMARYNRHRNRGGNPSEGYALNLCAIAA